MKLELYFPVKPVTVFQRFGNPNPTLYAGLGIIGHNGIDFWAPDSWPVYAAHEGEVVYAGVDAKEGWGIVVRTLQPFEYLTGEAYFKTIYWHLRKDGIKVKVGQKVKAGNLLGLADSTGLSFGNHLHFGLKPQYNGENDWTWWNAEQDNGYKGAINPSPYWNGICARDASTWIQVKALVTNIALKAKILAELIKVAVGFK